MIVNRKVNFFKIIGLILSIFFSSCSGPYAIHTESNRIKNKTPIYLHIYRPNAIIIYDYSLFINNKKIGELPTNNSALTFKLFKEGAYEISAGMKNKNWEQSTIKGEFFSGKHYYIRLSPNSANNPAKSLKIVKKYKGQKEFESINNYAKGHANIDPIRKLNSGSKKEAGKGKIKQKTTVRKRRKPDEDQKEQSNSSSRVDKKIPITDYKNVNTYAIVIGNENYTKYQNSLTSEQNVPFAKRDARIFAKYCRKTLGIPEDNIRLDTNVTKGQMQRHIDWLVKLSKYGGPNTKLIFYYSGHGFPDQETKKKYLVPVDIAGSQVTEGIHVSSLYDKLLKHDPKRATVFLDACFSGAGRGNKGLLAAKGVKVEPKESAIMDGNLVAFSSSQGDQRSWFYREKKHGLFTYFLLKKLQQTKGRVTYGALEAYLTKKVPVTSITTHNSEQAPQVNYSREIEGEWQDWRLR